MNILAILVAAVVSMLLGWLWYGPLFGKLWMQLSGIKPDKSKMNDMWKYYLGNFITVIVTAFVIGFFVNALEMSLFGEGLVFGFLAWLGFVGPITFGMVLWEGKSWKLWVLLNTYTLLSLVLMSGIIAAWT